MAMAGVGENFNIGRVVSRTFELVGRNFVPFFVLSFVFSGIPAIVLNFFQPTDPSVIQNAPGAYITTMLIGVLITVAAGVVLQGALTRASIDDLSGKGVQLGTALSGAASMLLPLVGLGLLVALGVSVGLILLVIPGIFLALCWAVSAPVMVTERLGVVASMQRSMQLTQNHRWAILGLGVLYFIAYMIVAGIVALVVGGTTGLMSGGQMGLVPLIVLTIVGVIASVVATVGAAAIYFELRQIKEGVGITELAKVFA